MQTKNIFRYGRKYGALLMSFALVAPFLSPLPILAAEETVLSVTMQQSGNIGGQLKRGQSNKISSLTFTAVQGKTEIMRLTLNLTGTGDPKDVERVQLFNEFGALVSTGKIQENTVLFTDLKRLTLAEGERATLTIQVDIGRNAELGKTYGVEIKSADAIHLPTDNYRKREATGAFPLRLPPLPVTDSTMEVFLRAAFANESATRKYFPIAQEMNIATLELSAFGKDVTVNKIILIKSGDLKEKYLRQLWLTEDGDPEAVGNFALVDGELVYNTPITIKAGETKLLQIGTTLPWEAGELKNFFFEIDPAKGIKATSNGKLVPIIADASPLRTKILTVISPSISMWRSWLNPKPRNLKAGEKDVVLMEIEAQSTTADIDLDAMRVRIESGADALENVRLLKKPGLRLTPSRTEAGDFVFKSPGRLDAGKIESFQVIADIGKYARNGEQITVLIPKQNLATGLPTYAEEIRGSTFVIGKKQNSGNLKLAEAMRIQNVLAGSSDAPLMVIDFSTQEGAVEIEKLRFTKTEKGKKGIFSNFQLQDASGRFRSEGKIDGDLITFSTPFGIEDGSSEQFILTADVADTEDELVSIHLQLTDNRSIEAIGLETGMPATVTGKLPLKSTDIEVIKPEEKIHLLVTGASTDERSIAQGEVDNTLGQITFEARGDDMIIDRLLLTREGTLSHGLTDLRLKGDNGQITIGRLSDSALIFDTPLRLSADTRVKFTLLGTLLPNAALASDIRFTVSGADQARLRVSGSNVIPVYANYPLNIGGFTVVNEDGKACAQSEKKTVCGRLYADAKSGPVFKTYQSRCELREDDALLVSEGTCESLGNDDADFTAAPFSDVPSSHPFAEAINTLRKDGVLEGTGNGRFQPENTLTRAELLKLVVAARFDDAVIDRCIQQNSARATAVFFPDVPRDAWFAPFVCVAQTQGWVKGYPDGTFRPNEQVAFAGAAKIIVNAFYPDAFEDGNPWFEPYVEFLSDENAVPESVVSMSHKLNRGETAELIWRLREKVTDRDSRGYNSKRHILE